MDGILGFLWRGLPAYVWVGIIYAIVVIGLPVDASNVPALEAELSRPFTTIPLLNGSALYVSWLTIFIAMGFVAVWVEVIRATNISDSSGNDWMSLVFTFVAILIFVGAAPFGTTAFLVVPLVGFGDLLLDRLVGQAVCAARLQRRLAKTGIMYAVRLDVVRGSVGAL